MATVLERLATLEAQQAQGNLICARTEANTKDILEIVRTSNEKSDARFVQVEERFDKRCDLVETRVTKVETHMGWMKGIFATAQAVVLAAVGWFYK